MTDLNAHLLDDRGQDSSAASEMGTQLASPPPALEEVKLVNVKETKEAMRKALLDKYTTIDAIPGVGIERNHSSQFHVCLGMVDPLYGHIANLPLREIKIKYALTLQAAEELFSDLKTEYAKSQKSTETKEVKDSKKSKDGQDDESSSAASAFANIRDLTRKTVVYLDPADLINVAIAKQSFSAVRSVETRFRMWLTALDTLDQFSDTMREGFESMHKNEEARSNARCDWAKTIGCICAPILLITIGGVIIGNPGGVFTGFSALGWVSSVGGAAWGAILCCHCEELSVTSYSADAKYPTDVSDLSFIAVEQIRDKMRRFFRHLQSTGGIGLSDSVVRVLMGEEKRSLTKEEENEVLTRLRDAWGTSVQWMINNLLIIETASDAKKALKLVIKYLVFIVGDKDAAQFKKDFIKHHVDSVIEKLKDLYAHPREKLPKNLTEQKLAMLAAYDSPFKERALKACKELGIKPAQDQSSLEESASTSSCYSGSASSCFSGSHKV